MAKAEEAAPSRTRRPGLPPTGLGPPGPGRPSLGRVSPEKRASGPRPRLPSPGRVQVALGQEGPAPRDRAGEGRLPAATFSPPWEPREDPGTRQRPRVSLPRTRGADPHLRLPGRPRGHVRAAPRSDPAPASGNFPGSGRGAGPRSCCAPRSRPPSPGLPPPPAGCPRRPLGTPAGRRARVRARAQPPVSRRLSRPTPPPPFRGARRPSFLPRESESREEKVRASGLPSPWGRSSAPAIAGHPTPRAPASLAGLRGQVYLRKGAAQPRTQGPGGCRSRPCGDPELRSGLPAPLWRRLPPASSSSSATSAARPSRELLSLGRGWESAERPP
ncbi:proline-rich protein 2-like [Artibeus jamaicensis]|uniref:proline-rich protein 2-like n=1 Tax=Artibeus jamaicensis TaxID=9417 RepID=UPI00235B1C9F|nr:proline-rich protein 2-like [Artibeus jamaicensis]